MKAGLALYIHVPFCIRKCPYCDFYSRPGVPIDESRYVEALIRELWCMRARLQHDERDLTSIFFGGGTPSLLSGAAIQTILDVIRAAWHLTPDCEITLEANPESCSRDKAKWWREAGVNRVSLGVQAVDDARLLFLQRPHDVAMAREAARHLTGWARVNLDLIYGTPDQTVAEWRNELTRILDWGMEHLSCYALTLEPGTRFHAAGLKMPAEEKAVELFEFTRAFLTEQGFPPYEISNFARPGCECRHNLHVWEYGDYLGLGPGAHGKWTDAHGLIWRCEPERSTTDDPVMTVGQPRQIPPNEAGQEYLMTGLRLTQGMSRKQFFQITGQDFIQAHSDTLQRLVELRWIEIDAQRIRLTPSGVLLADTIMLELL